MGGSEPVSMKVMKIDRCFLETAGAASSNQKVVTDSTLPQMEAAVRLIGNNLKFTDFVKVRKCSFS